MKRIPMIAAKVMRYGTRMLRAGDTFDAVRQDARVLTAVGLASECHHVVTKPAPVPAPVRVATRPAPVPRPAPVLVQTEPVADAEIDALRAEYETRTGRTADRRWGIARLKAEIEA